jgi:hypothetical protein
LDYGAIFRWLDLTPPEIETFMEDEMLLDQMLIDLRAAVELHRVDANSNEYKSLMADYNQARNTRKKEILGDRHERYLEYYRTREVRWLPRELVYAGIFSGEPIRAAEVERVADILVANCQRVLTTGVPATNPVGAWGYVSGVNWPAAKVQLEGVLSPRQIETLELLIKQELAEQKLRDYRGRLTAQFKAQSTAE